MPLVEIALQREIAEFYKNRKDIMKEVVCYSIRENEEEQQKIDKYINLIDEAWMEMEYVLYNQRYYITFANNYGEKHMLEESNYIMFYLKFISPEFAKPKSSSSIVFSRSSNKCNNRNKRIKILKHLFIS